MGLTARNERREPFKIDLSGVFIRRTDLSNANLEGADLSGADCTNVNFCGANLRGAKLDGTILKGADFTDARNLTHAQIQSAIIDERTILPANLEK